MSDALTFLAQARPDAVGPYMTFLKACGTRLDPKTRALISIITKVHAQTERGLRQYVKRGLRDGCTPEEILDAMLMAFPALGLSKIIWAVDVMLAMDPPVLAWPSKEDPAAHPAPAPSAPAASWHALGPAQGFEAGGTRHLAVDGRPLFVHRVAEHDAEPWKVWDARCPHQGTDMPAQALTGTTLTCPQHGWAFDVRNGACIAVGERPLNGLPVKVTDGQLYAHW